MTRVPSEIIEANPGPVATLIKRGVEKPEPPGWSKRDDVMEAVFSNNRRVPMAFFLGWYGCVQVANQIRRLIWIAGWERKRRRLQRRLKGSAEAVDRVGALTKQLRDF